VEHSLVSQDMPMSDDQSSAADVEQSSTTSLGECVDEDYVVVLIHICKCELSLAHLVCPWRHNA
jgi:hypothetical protein